MNWSLPTSEAATDGIIESSTRIASHLSPSFWMRSSVTHIVTVPSACTLLRSVWTPRKMTRSAAGTCFACEKGSPSIRCSCQGLCLRTLEPPRPPMRMLSQSLIARRTCLQSRHPRMRSSRPSASLTGASGSCAGGSIQPADPWGRGAKQASGGVATQERPLFGIQLCAVPWSRAFWALGSSRLNGGARVHPAEPSSTTCSSKKNIKVQNRSVRNRSGKRTEKDTRRRR